jgi:hypothetical protein
MGYYWRGRWASSNSYVQEGGIAWIHVTESKIRTWVLKNSVMDFQIWLKMCFSWLVEWLANFEEKICSIELRIYFCQHILLGNVFKVLNLFTRLCRYCVIFFLGATVPSGPGTPLDEWSARRRDLCLTTHNTRNRQISMPPAEFEHAVSESERPQTHALDRSVTGEAV